MNFNQIVNMVLRIFTRKAVNFGINKGIQMAAKHSPAAGKAAKDARAAAKRARQAARITRRMR